MALLAALRESRFLHQAASAMSLDTQEVRMVFDAPPGRNMPTLVEIEDQSGRPIEVGEWRARPDGYWELVIPVQRR